MYKYKNFCYSTCPNNTYIEGNQCLLNTTTINNTNLSNSTSDLNLTINNLTGILVISGSSAKGFDSAIPILLITLSTAGLFALLVVGMYNVLVKGAHLNSQSLTFIFTPIELLSKALLVPLLWDDDSALLMGLSASIVMVSPVVGGLFISIYISLYEQTVKNFKSFMKHHPRIYQAGKWMTYACGPNMTKIFTSGFFGANAEFHHLEPYVEMQNKHIMVGVFANVVQIAGDLGILLSAPWGQPTFIVAVINLVLNSIIWIGLLLEKFELKQFFNTIATTPHYDAVHDVPSQVNTSALRG
jgi:hypothetical protein